MLGEVAMADGPDADGAIDRWMAADDGCGARGRGPLAGRRVRVDVFGEAFERATIANSSIGELMPVEQREGLLQTKYTRQQKKCAVSHVCCI